MQTVCTILTKPVVVNIRTAGSTQLDYNDYASLLPAGDILCGFHYPLVVANMTEWANISKLGDYSQYIDTDALLKVRFAARASSREYWFVAQAFTGINPHTPNFGTEREPLSQNSGLETATSRELKWIVHRILVEGASGVLLYHFNRSHTDLHYAMKNMGLQIELESVNRAIGTTPKDNYYLATGRAQLTASSGGSILWTYHYFGNSYWLLVVDKTPDRPAGTGGVGTRSYTFRCDLETRINDLQFLTERYDNPGNNLGYSRIGGTSVVEFSHQMEQGGVKLYRFFCGA